jgi:hypothetical protein
MVMQMNIKTIASLMLLVVISACGGGGGDPGTTGGGTTTRAASLTMSLVDAGGNTVSTPSLSQVEARQLKVVVKTASNKLVANKRVNVTLDSNLAVLTPASGSQLTNDEGVAFFAIAPTSVTASGAVTAEAKATVDGAEVSQQYDMQIARGDIQLSTLSVTPSSVQKGQAVTVSVGVVVNGVAAASNSVGVSFASNCGTVSPALSLVDASGQAKAVVQTNIEGSCTVTASADGAGTIASPFTVTVPPVIGIQFVQASPQVIYQKGLSGDSSLVTFKVIDALNDPVQGQTVTASIVGDGGGVSFCGATSSALSGQDGTVTFAVCSGTQPTTVQVRAALTSNTAIATNSNLLTVQTGLATQRFFDLSANQTNFYVGGYFTDKFNGNTIDLTVFAADRQGNPVPNGTPVVFVTEGGQINSTGNSSCVLANGRCTVQLIGQDYRPLGSNSTGADPRPGRVTILAMADGEESFVDANNNNRYDSGELFEDLGRPYLNKNESSAFEASFTNIQTNTADGEVSYPLPSTASGTAACPTTSNVGLSVAGSCNGRWDGSTKVRRSITVVFSGGFIAQPGSYDASIPTDKRTEILSSTNSIVTFRLADQNGNPLPSDTALSVAVRQPTGGQCAASLSTPVIGNATEPTTVAVLLEKCTGVGESVDLKATVSAGGFSRTSMLTVAVPVP